MRQLLRRWLGIDSAERLAQRALERSARLDPTAPASGAAARQDERARQVLERVARDIRRLGRQIAILNGIVHQQADATAEALQRNGWQSEAESVEQRLLRQALQGIKGTGDVIVGPWTGEVGFELLYWIPFLNWLCEQGLEGSRLIVVSRGGTAPWYRHLTSRYVDILDVMTPEQLRERTTESSDKRKQFDPKRALDREILTALALPAGEKDATMLHPGTMFRLFGPLWRRRATIDLVDAFTSFHPLGVPEPADPALGLPERYIAAKFYFSESFPDIEENRAFVVDMLRRVSADAPVVLLGTGAHIDDHSDFRSAIGENVRVIDTSDHPQTNLARQTAIIRGARGFIGTYGGFSYLAPFYGVRSVSFFSRRSFEPHHLELAHRVFDRLLPGGFVALDTRATDLVTPPIQRWV